MVFFFFFFFFVFHREAKDLEQRLPRAKQDLTKYQGELKTVAAEEEEAVGKVCLCFVIVLLRHGTTCSSIHSCASWSPCPTVMELCGYFFGFVEDPCHYWAAVC